MCGIAGTFGQVSPALVDSMTKRLTHRGPDGLGTTRLGAAGLGNTRLSLIDPELGAQPMVTPRGNLALVFNGEIYNHGELRSRLARLGHRFIGHGDTEVLLHALDEWGTDCIRDLEGMFAIAAIDGDRLVLARDWFGIKPLFYWLDGAKRQLAFASEIKALLEVPGVSRMLDRQALFELRTLGYILGPKTLFRSIKQVAPGCIVEVSLSDDGGLKVTTLKHSEPTKVGIPSSQVELEALVLRQLDASVQEQCLADFPVGVFLSGGLDSSIMTGLLARSGQAPVHTFTVVDSVDHPDAMAARLVSKTLGTIHHEYLFEPSELVSRMPANMVSCELPFSFGLIDSSAGAVRQHVKAVLCGDGADELFAGYRIHLEPTRLVEVLAERYDNRAKRLGIQEMDYSSCRDALGTLKSVDGNACLQSVYEFLLDSQLFNSHLWLWDRASMAEGLEVRVPYLSSKVRDLALALPWPQRLPVQARKPILRSIARSVLPHDLAEWVLNRGKSAGPSAFRQAGAILAEFGEMAVPPGFAEHHPFRAFCDEPIKQLQLDLFVYLFVANDGKVPQDFTINDLYGRCRAELSDALETAAGNRSETRA